MGRALVVVVVVWGVVGRAVVVVEVWVGGGDEVWVEVEAVVWELRSEGLAEGEGKWSWGLVSGVGGAGELLAGGLL